MTIVEILTKARELLTVKGWTQGKLARDKDNEEVGRNSPLATCYCAEGAIYVAAGNEPYSYAMAEAAERLLERFIQGKSIEPVALHRWNDEPWRKLSEVLAAFDGTIAQELAPCC